MTERFALPAAFAVLAVLPVVALVWRRRRAGAVLFSNLGPVAGLGGTWRTGLRWLPALCRLSALALVIVAIARPQREAGRLPTKREGIAIQLVIDRSGSMQEPMSLGKDAAGRRRDGQGAEQTSKLDVVKQLTHDFLLGNGKDLTGRPDDLVGLVTFARYADTVAPLVRSPEIVVELARQLEPALVRGEDGTAIGDGLALGAARLKKTEEAGARADQEQAFNPASRIVILMTDGQNNAGQVDPMQAAELARQWGIKVYTIGIGAGASARATGDIFQDFQVRLGGVDEQTLTAIAEATGGRYFAAADGSALRDVYAQINTLEKSSLAAPESTLYEELFTPLAAGAGVLLLLQTALSATIFRRVP